MFRCGFCQKTTAPGGKQVLVVTETRSKQYPEGGRGTEIVHQVPACASCAKEVHPCINA